MNEVWRKKARPCCRPELEILEARFLLSSSFLTTPDSPTERHLYVGPGPALTFLHRNSDFSISVNRSASVERPGADADLPSFIFKEENGLALPHGEESPAEYILEHAESAKSDATAISLVALSRSGQIQERDTPRLPRLAGTPSVPLDATATAARARAVPGATIEPERSPPTLLVHRDAGSAAVSLVPDKSPPRNASTGSAQDAKDRLLTPTSDERLTGGVPVEVLLGAVIPLDRVLPIDPELLQRATDAFFGRLAEISDGLTELPSISHAAWLVAGAALAVECSRRWERRAIRREEERTGLTPRSS